VWGGDIDDEMPMRLRDAPLYLRGIPFADPLGYDLTYFPALAESILDVVVVGLRVDALPEVLDDCGDRFMDVGRLERLRAVTRGWNDATLDRVAWDGDARSLFATRGAPFDALPAAVDYINGVTGDPLLDDDGQEVRVDWVPWGATAIRAVREAHAAALASIGRFGALHRALAEGEGQDVLLAALEELSGLLDSLQNKHGPP